MFAGVPRAPGEFTGYLRLNVIPSTPLVILSP